jgi:hypothetical protein
MTRWWRLVLAWLMVLAPTLSACGSTALLTDVVLSQPVLQPSGAGETLAISYVVGREALVSVALVAADGTTYPLRRDQRRMPSGEPYTLQFDGTAPTDDPVIRRRALPGGMYRVVLAATGVDGTRATAEVPLQIVGDERQPPSIDGLVAAPTTISPNADGIDDVSEITFSVPVTTTVDLVVTGPDGTVYPFISGEELGPANQRFIWNGRTVDGFLLDDGAYRYTVRVRDGLGNVVERGGEITIADGGQPSATITYSTMAPQALMLGEVLTVTMRVMNDGDVPIRTYGPASGYEYTTDDVYSSIEDGAFTARSGGFWRIGVDWDANSGGGARRYPYRWAITPRPPEAWRIPFVEDVLLPGEEALVVGRIRVRQPETRMGFYVGLIQDGVGFFQDRTGRTIIHVGL